MEEEKTQGELSPEQPITEEKVQEMLAQATKPFQEQLRRFQSEKDKAISRAEKADRRASQMEQVLAATRQKIAETDPDAFREMRLTELEAKEKQQVTIEQEEKQREYIEELDKGFHGSLTEFITGLGIDPTDSRIDWAFDAPDYLPKQRRVLASVLKIQTENREKTLKQQTKDAEEKARVESGVYSVDKTSPALGERRSFTAEEIAKMSREEFKRQEKAIDAAYREGRIT